MTIRIKMHAHRIMKISVKSSTRLATSVIILLMGCEVEIAAGCCCVCVCVCMCACSVVEYVVPSKHTYGAL